MSELENFLTAKDLMEKFKVSKNWISDIIRSQVDPVGYRYSDYMEQDAIYMIDMTSSKPVTYYNKYFIFRFVLEHIRVYSTRTYHAVHVSPNFPEKDFVAERERVLNSLYTAKKRPPEVKVPIPDIIYKQIINDEFIYMNQKDMMELLNLNSNEQLYRYLYYKCGYILRLFGKTYYYIPDKPEDTERITWIAVPSVVEYDVKQIINPEAD